MQENKNWTPLLFLSPYNLLIVVPRPVWLPWKPRGRQGYPVLLETRVVSQVSRTKEPTQLERNRIVASHKEKGLYVTFSPRSQMYLNQCMFTSCNAQRNPVPEKDSKKRGTPH